MSDLEGINKTLVRRVDRLVTRVVGWPLSSTSYLLYPAKSKKPARYVIVSQGHCHDLGYGISFLADHFLNNGYRVLLVHMPLMGWNRDKQESPAGYKFIDHNDIFRQLNDKKTGKVFKVFLEPVIQGINFIMQQSKGGSEISMVGLSGGGWATSMIAAIDVRVKKSVPIAGSTPLYIRNLDHDRGDIEQFYEPLYGENIDVNGNGGGVSTWLEIYALGGYGSGRTQVKVLHEYDICCFAGRRSEAFAPIVSKKVEHLGGSWKLVFDASHKEHKISSYTIDNVINPLFEIPR